VIAAIGPGWSSFAVRGDLIYTQEQRGDDEVVSCYRLSTGEPVWRHRDPIRFWEAEGGAGPRRADAVAFACGRRSTLVALISRAPTDTGRFRIEVASSPSSSTASDRRHCRLVACVRDRRAAPRSDWRRRHTSRIWRQLDDVRRSHLLGRTAASRSRPTRCSGSTGVASVSIVRRRSPTAASDQRQRQMINGGIRRYRFRTRGRRAEERWNSRGLKPAFNDYVVHKGHAYGFDPSILSAIDLSDGSRKWKGGRYGNGQLLLLADQDLLLVVSEEGELALVSATPDQYAIARFDDRRPPIPVIVRFMMEQPEMVVPCNR
jgi:hypothetical protein